jgi:hypothetical protein
MFARAFGGVSRVPASPPRGSAGRDPIGVLGTIGLGIVGSFVGAVIVLLLLRAFAQCRGGYGYP